MKTIIDVVNEFKAEWPHNTLEIEWPHGALTCNAEQFNLQVAIMELNYGKCSKLNISDYKIVHKELLQPVKPDLIFTQEMCDNGELPSVGMECLYLDTSKEYIKCKVVYLSEWSIVLEQTEKGYAQGVEVAKAVDDVTIKPLTPPVELIDGKAYQFEHNGIVWNGIYIKRENSMWYSLRTAKVAFCTNIQPLTVGDK